jgi:hypothetical protein
MFIETSDLRIVAMSEIAEFRKNPRGESYTVCLKNGGAAGAISFEAMSLIMRRQEHTIMPAAPGFQRLFYFSDENGEVVHKEEVIAWAVDINYAPIPITETHSANDHYEDHGPVYLISPNGAVRECEMQSWPNYTAWIEDMRRMNGAAS